MCYNCSKATPKGEISVKSKDPMFRDSNQQPENLTGDKYSRDEEKDSSPAPGYHRPAGKAKKSRAAGLISFILSILALLLLGVVLLNLYLAYRQSSIAIGDTRFAKIGVIVAAVLSVLGLIAGIAALCLRKQKKAFAIAGVILSLLIGFSSCAAIYIHQYVFSTMNHQELNEKELHVAEPATDGEINRETAEEIQTMAPEEIESLMEENRKDWGENIEWEYLTDQDIPEEALSKMNTNSQFGKSFLLDGHEKISNYLLLGIDRHESSDAIMICSVDRVHHKIKLISIPRDSYVLIPEFGTYAKLTYAFCWGEAPGTIGTINRNFNLNISEYIAVDFEQLEGIIDLVGGVDVDLDYAEMRYLGYADNIRHGMSHLNGKQGLTYARIRSSSPTDCEANRTGRQREVVMSILDSLSKMPMTSYPEFIRECLRMSETSFGSEELLELSLEVLQKHYTVEQYALIDRMDYWGGLIGKEQYFYVVYDLNRASDQLYRIIYEDLYISGYKD